MFYILRVLHVMCFLIGVPLLVMSVLLESLGLGLLACAALACGFVLNGRRHFDEF